jgi:hypothetical protein
MLGGGKTSPFDPEKFIFLHPNCCFEGNSPPLKNRETFSGILCRNLAMIEQDCCHS